MARRLIVLLALTVLATPSGGWGFMPYPNGLSVIDQREFEHLGRKARAIGPDNLAPHEERRYLQLTNQIGGLPSREAAELAQLQMRARRLGNEARLDREERLRYRELTYRMGTATPGRGPEPRALSAQEARELAAIELAAESGAGRETLTRKEELRMVQLQYQHHRSLPAVTARELALEELARRQRRRRIQRQLEQTEAALLRIR